METIVKIDQSLFLTLNGAGVPWLDPFMILMSSIWVWIPVFAWFLWSQIRRHQWNAVSFLLMMVLVYAASDQVSNHLLKETIQRLRPCHDPELAAQVRLVAGKCGGLYSFVSTHSSNAFSVAVFSMMIIRSNIYTLIILVWASLVAYSRIYLGVHFPGDVLGGILLGFILGTMGTALLPLLQRCTCFKKPATSNQ